MASQPKRFYEFGPFRLDVGEGQLLRDGQAVPISPKAFDTLLTLVENSGHVLSKDELLQAVWPDSFVEETNLAHHISAIRKALGDSANGSRYIETAPKRGYRFVAEVKCLPETGTVLPLKDLTRASVSVEEASDREEEIRESVATEMKAGTAGERRQSIPEPIISGGRRNAGALALGLTAVIIAGLALAALYAARSSQSGESKATAPPIKSIAVLPFKPLLADRRDEAIELGIADDLIARLGDTGQVIVRPISAVRQYTALDQDPIAAGRELKVDAVLDGSIHWDGQRVRITARLLRVADGAVLWSDRCDQDQCTDIFALQASISEQLARALALKLSSETQGLLTRRYTENKEAWRLYIRGRYLMHKFTSETIKQAKECYERAIDLDPSYALAYAGLADWYLSVGGSPTMPAREAMPRGEALARRALELDDSLAEAYTVVGLCELLYRWDWVAAEQALKRALDLKPNSPDSLVNYATYLMAMKRFDEAIALQERAWELDPLSFAIGVGLAGLNSDARRYDEAIRQYRRLIEKDQNSGMVYYFLGRAYLQKGMCDEALEAFQKQQTIVGSPEIAEAMRKACAASGCNNAIGLLIRHWVEASQEAERKGVYFPTAHINNYALAGDKEKTLFWLEKAYEERHSCLLGLGSSTFDGLRSDPRFQDLVQRVGLPQ